MPLNLTVNDGEFVPYLKYNGKAGRWYVKAEQGGEVEVINPRFAIDFANIKTGWMMFSEGLGLVAAWDDGQQMAAKPEGKYRRGFLVMVCGADALPGIGPLGLREFASTAGVVITPILAMYTEYEAQMGTHPGQVPFFQCMGVKPISGVHGTNYEPLFQLGGWVPRDRVPQFDAELAKAAPVNSGAPFAPPPDMSAHGAPPPNRPVHPDPFAPLGGGGFNPPDPGGDLDDEIPF